MAEPKPTATQRMYQTASDVLRLIEQGQVDKAFQKISSFRGDSTVNRYTLIRVLVSTGQQKRNKAILESALYAFERLKAKANTAFEPIAYYDIANGYLDLYSIAVHEESANVFDCEAIVRFALRYGERGATSGPWAFTNVGNLFDEVGRPLEALRCYERALAIDPNFGMAIGNKAMAIETLAPVTRYWVVHLVQAHQLYQAAITRADSVADAGLEGSLESFQAHDDAIIRQLTEIGRADALEWDLHHEPYDDSPLSDFVKFYTRFCLQHDLYLNMHLADRSAAASIADEIVPR